MCFDKRVLIGLGVVAVVLLAINPGLFGGALPFLVLLACPLSMVVMMWAMSGTRKNSCATEERSADSAPETEVAELRDEVARLRAELDLRGSSAPAMAPVSALPTLVGTRIADPLASWQSGQAG
jgi:hypothetical protein